MNISFKSKYFLKHFYFKKLNILLKKNFKMGIDYKSGDSNEFREMASRICRDYLRGSWKKITSSDIQIKRISGGLSNWLYHLSLPSSLPPRSNEPQEVLLRLYGQVHGERALEALVTESVIFTLLSERRLGPRLHGVFPGGRIEEYIPARPLQTQELAEPQLSVLIAQKMALIHTMNVPISKEPRWLWDSMNRWLILALSNLQDPGTLKNKDRHHVARLREINFKSEVKWLRELLKGIKSPVVFCHNDLQEGNILLKMEVKDPGKNSTPDLVVIDFEYCAYNHRGFDLANHFAEWRYDYTNPEWPHFYRDIGEPTLEQKIHFIGAYLQTMEDHNTNPEDILEEIEAYSLASHLFWTLWSIVNAKLSQIPFGYWDYAAERLNMYYKIKNSMLPRLNLEVKVKEE